MNWIQTLHLYSIVLILKLFNWGMPMNVHGALVNRLLAFFDQDERHQIIEDYLRQLAEEPYWKDRGFSSAEEEVDSYLKFVPHMEPYRSVLVNICRNNRQPAGLQEEQKTT
ncbi:MAG: hypothetical protein Q8N42_02045 [bacterium]|nr:hypothetical protein [bacterium]